MIDQKRFSGIMDTDSKEDFILPSNHKDALNLRFYGTSAGLRAENIKGNTLITNSLLPAGNNECIGSYYDGLRQRIIWFNWNSNNRHGIYQYDIQTATVTRLLQSFINSVDDILGFSRDYPIPSVVMLYTTESDGDILHWVARNKRPMKLNLLDAVNNVYGAAWTYEILTVARSMPLIPPTSTYHDDATVSINNLRKKLYEFSFRWVYKDFTKSTWSPYSKLIAPAVPDDVANNINEQKNNRIDVTINTGAADVISIEVAARQTLAKGFTDDFIIATLNKADLGLLDNQQYAYEFYNDASYPYINLKERQLLFDYVPRIANTMELLNGNVIIYGGILEGYDFDETLNMTLTVTSVAYSISQSLLVTLVYEQSEQVSTGPPLWLYDAVFDVTGAPSTGDVVRIEFTTSVIAPTFITYTVLPGDTAALVAQGLVNAFNALVQTPAGQWVASTYAFTPSGVGFRIQSPIDTSTQLLMSNISIQYATNLPIDGVSNSIYKHKSRYGIGLVYFDQYGVTNGVVTNATLLFETPEVSTTGNTVTTIPKISISISHQPPIWATSYAFVRTANLSVQSLLPTITASTKKDSNYAYLEITNQQLNQNGFPAYEFLEGDRVRIIGKYGAAVGTVYDFPIVSMKESPVIGGVVTPGSFLLVPYNAVLSNFGTAGFNNYDLEIYTPATSVSKDQQQYFEFGENYLVLNPGTSGRRHEGQIQNQVIGGGAQAATFIFVRGDFYIKERKIPFNANLSNPLPVWIVDQSVSDFFPSLVVGNGRAFVVDEYAVETYYPTRVRWGREYQQETNINQTNRFYPDQVDDIDRDKGDIQRFKTRDRILRIFQNRGCGQYGIYSRFIKNNQGSTDLITTDDIITANNIQYYLGEFGMGNQYSGLVSGTNQDYFSDPVRGYQLRLSQNGFTEISEKYYGKFYISSLLPPYNKTWTRTGGGNAKIIGCYDFSEDQAMFILQGGTRSGNTIADYHFSFNENRNAYCSFYDFYPEWMICAEDILYSWRIGTLWIHNNTADYCKFYLSQSDCSITLVFNINLLEKKSWESVTEVANAIWACPTIYSSVMSYGSTRQESNLVSSDFAEMERQFHSAFLRDSNSIGGILNGDFLKGEYLVVKFQKTSASNLIYLSSVSVEFSDSPLTNK